MTGYADIMALWIRTLQLAKGKVADREHRAMTTMVNATWEALAECGHDMERLKTEVRRLMAEGDNGSDRGKKASAA
jgi:hypothetical protein